MPMLRSPVSGPLPTRPRRSAITVVGMFVCLGWWLVLNAPAAHAAAASVYLNVPIAQPERPANLPDDDQLQTAPHDPSKFLDVQSFVNGITWTSWGEATATGTGTVKVNSSDTRPGHAQPYASQSAPVVITAGGLTTCGGQQLYTSYHLTLSGATPALRDFADAETRTLPCRLHALNYYAGYEQVAHTTGDCLFHGVSEALPHGFGYFDYCRMGWQGWGQSTTTGTGIGRAIALPSGCDGRHGECDYGIRVTLSQPAWCPAYGMSYTRERLEVFGRGDLTTASFIAPGEERSLRATIGHSPRRVSIEQVRASQHCRLPDARAAVRARAHSAAPSTVYLNQPGLSSAVEPRAFPVAEYNDPHDPNTLAESRILSASWSGWGAATATAQGEAHVQWADANTGPDNLQEVTLPVVITASGSQTCGGVMVYTGLSKATAPPHFSQVQTDEDVGPCRVHAGAYVAGQQERTDPNGCFFKGLKETIIRSPFSLDYCAMHWHGWGQATTTGLGVARIGFKQYGLRVRLSQIRTCQRWGATYTQETAEVWGAGEAITGQGNVSDSEAAKLTALIGRAGQPHKTLRLSLPGRAGCASTASTAGAASSVSAQAAHDAEALAERIEAAGRRGSPAWRSVERVSGCCGVRSIEVRERARVNAHGQYGSYFLWLVRQPGLPEGVAKVSITEAVTKRLAYREHEPHYELLYDFALAPEHPTGPWQIATTYPWEHNEGGTVTASTGGHDYHLTLAELGTLYGQALQVLAKAEQHKPVGQEAYLWPPQL